MKEHFAELATKMKAEKGHSQLKVFLCFSLFTVLCAVLFSSTIVFPQQRSNDGAELLEVGRAGALVSAPKALAEIKIVSYNIRWRGGDDLETLINLLRNDSEIAGASILGLQEVDRNKRRTKNINTVKAIAEKLGHHYAWAAPPTVKSGNEEETGVAILSSYPLMDVRRILLPNPGPGRRRRVAIGATIEIAGTPVRVYSVHSENRIPVDEKLEQTRAVLADLDTFPKHMRAIIMGDLNTWEPSSVKKTSELFRRESFTTPIANDKSTFLQTVLFVPIKFKLDWIWLRGLEATSHGIDKKVGLSDHWPLWVVVGVKPSEKTK